MGGGERRWNILSSCGKEENKKKPYVRPLKTGKKKLHINTFPSQVGGVGVVEAGVKFYCKFIIGAFIFWAYCR